MSLDKLKDLLDSFTSSAELEEVKGYYKDSTFSLISNVAYLSYYPYQMYINWSPADEGNILFNDKKFVTLLYQWNHDEFTDLSKVSDVSALTKHNIYDFIEMSEKTVFVVDCENSDPYRLCATLRNLDNRYR